MQDSVAYELIDSWAICWSSQDPTRLPSIFTEDCVYEDVPMNRVNSGKAELQTFVHEFFTGFPDIKVIQHSAFASGTHGVLQWTLEGTNTGPLPKFAPTGKKISLRGVSVFEFEGDKIKRCTDYWDRAAFLQQLGVMPGI